MTTIYSRTFYAIDYTTKFVSSDPAMMSELEILKGIGCLTFIQDYAAFIYKHMRSVIPRDSISQSGLSE